MQEKNAIDYEWDNFEWMHIQVFVCIIKINILFQSRCNIQKEYCNFMLQLELDPHISSTETLSDLLKHMVNLQTEISQLFQVSVEKHAKVIINGIFFTLLNLKIRHY